MAYEVAVRNPERYKGFIEVLARHEGQVLNDENILNSFPFDNNFASAFDDSDEEDEE